MNTEPVEYDIVPAPPSQIQRVDAEPPIDAEAARRAAFEESFQRLSQRVDVAKRIRQAMADAQRKALAGPKQAKQKSRTRKKSKVAAASRKRNRR